MRRARRRPSPSARTRKLSLDSFTSRRSRPEKGAPSRRRSGAGRRPPPQAPASGYKRADLKDVERVAFQVLRKKGGAVSSQHALWKEVSRRLRKEDPPRYVGPIRMRALLATSSLVRLSVRYANRGGKHPLMTCPVCFHPIRPRYNETLWGDSSVIVGYRCTSCPFWTPRQRRMPAQYTFRSTFHDEAAPASAT